MKRLNFFFAVAASLLANQQVLGASGMPDAIADSMRSDGFGYIDLGYRYHMSSFPKTSKVVCEFYDNSWGRGRGSETIISDKIPRNIFGYQDSPRGSLSAARYNGGSNAMIYYGAWQDDKKFGIGRFDTVVTIDYEKETASWSCSENDGEVIDLTGVTKPNQDAAGSYYLFANNVIMEMIFVRPLLLSNVFGFMNVRSPARRILPVNMSHASSMESMVFMIGCEEASIL